MTNGCDQAVGIPNRSHDEVHIVHDRSRYVIQEVRFRTRRHVQTHLMNITNNSDDLDTCSRWVVELAEDVPAQRISVLRDHTSILLTYHRDPGAAKIAFGELPPSHQWNVKRHEITRTHKSLFDGPRNIIHKMWQPLNIQIAVVVRVFVDRQNTNQAHSLHARKPQNSLT